MLLSLFWFQKRKKWSNPRNLEPFLCAMSFIKSSPKSFIPISRLNMPLLVSPDKSGFVDSHRILDNFILAHELVHSLKSTKTSRMLIKLDMSKYFDKISWQYITSTLHVFGFTHTRLTRFLHLFPHLSFRCWSMDPPHPLFGLQEVFTKEICYPLHLHSNGWGWFQSKPQSCCPFTLAPRPHPS